MDHGGGRNFVDISPWMLVEDSGDSEFDFGMSSCCCVVRSSSTNRDNRTAVGSSPSLSSSGVLRLDTPAAALPEDGANYRSWDYEDRICKPFDDEDDSCSITSSRPGDDDGVRNGGEVHQLNEVANRGHCKYRDDDVVDEDDDDDDVVDQVRKPSGGGGGGFRGRRGPPEQPPPEGGGGGVMGCCGRRKPADHQLVMVNQRDADRLFWESCLSS